MSIKAFYKYLHKVGQDTGTIHDNIDHTTKKIFVYHNL